MQYTQRKKDPATRAIPADINDPSNTHAQYRNQVDNSIEQNIDDIVEAYKYKQHINQ